MKNQRRIFPLFLAAVLLVALSAAPGPAWGQNPAAIRINTSFFIAAAVISVQTYRAATADPARSMRYE